MNYKRLIIDGYNLLHQIPELAQLIRSDREGARHRLVRHIETAANHMADKTTIVFDGREAGRDAALSSPYMKVVYSPGNLSADTVIERMAFESTQPVEIMVVTSDVAERTTVSSAGALTMSCREFLDRCDSAVKTAAQFNPKNKPPRGPRLGDFFPDDLK